MAIFKCKMCGGDLNIQEGTTVCECEYCFTKQTIPSLDNEKKLNLFNRANRLRLNSEFDKAANIYESIIAEFPEEAEGYWGLVLCNYGIEYVDDPATARKIPTCHRAAFESVANDENYQLALEYADVVSQKVYRDEAREIDRIMSEILSISKTEKPYDIFICYKETDMTGGRTIDSVIAQDVYDALTDKGYRVFFSRISLEDKIGKQYEPYIFAALNSAKVMLAFGTKYEYFQAVWVKNEWSRFLKLMAKDKSKNLVPCYKDMDAYDMPDEFKALQAQDMGKVGAVQDLLRGIEKLIPKNKPTYANMPIVSSNGVNATPETLLARVYMYLEDRNWKSADTYCEKILDSAPSCAEAYITKLMALKNISTKEEMYSLDIDLDNESLYLRALKFADDDYKNVLVEYRNESLYKKAVRYEESNNINRLDDAFVLFGKLHGYKDSNERLLRCAELVNTDKYNTAIRYKESAIKGNDPDFSSKLDKAIALFSKLGKYRDSAEQKVQCEQIKVVMTYNAAVTIIRTAADTNIALQTKAAELFMSVANYQDARAQADVCRQKIEYTRNLMEREKALKKELADIEFDERELGVFSHRGKKLKRRKTASTVMRIFALITLLVLIVGAFVSLEVLLVGIVLIFVFLYVNGLVAAICEDASEILMLLIPIIGAFKMYKYIWDGIRNIFRPFDQSEKTFLNQYITLMNKVEKQKARKREVEAELQQIKY